MKHCPECGKKVQQDWKVCAYCNFKFYEKLVECSNCHQLIGAADPTFCPYCSNQLKVKDVPQQTETKVLTQELNPVASTQLNRKLFMDMLSFRLHSMMKISGNNSTLNDYSYLLIWITGLLTAINYLMIDMIFINSTGNMLTEVFVGIAVVVPVSLYLIVIFSNQMVKNLGKDLKVQHWRNMMAAYFPLFLIKDLLIVLITLYVMFVGGTGDGSIPITTTIILNVVLYIFIMIQFTVLMKNWLDISGFISFILMSFVFYFSLMFSGVYLFDLVRNLVRLLELVI